VALEVAAGDVDDAPKASRDHAVDGGLDQLDGRQHVGFNRFEPVLSLELTEVAARRAIGVVYEDVGLWARFEQFARPSGLATSASTGVTVEWTPCSHARAAKH
jgi:hypothetical protein